MDYLQDYNQNWDRLLISSKLAAILSSAFEENELKSQMGGIPSPPI
jgi:hypothetical protein